MTQVKLDSRICMFKIKLVFFRDYTLIHTLSSLDDSNFQSIGGRKNILPTELRFVVLKIKLVTTNNFNK